MEKQLIEEEMFYKHYDGLRAYFLFSDLPTNLLPTDKISFERFEAYYSENESNDDHTVLSVNRDRIETDAEFEKRKSQYEIHKEFSRKKRYETYMILKKEFENDVNI